MYSNFRTLTKLSVRSAFITASQVALSRPISITSLAQCQPIVDALSQQFSPQVVNYARPVLLDNPTSQNYPTFLELPQPPVNGKSKLNLLPDDWSNNLAKQYTGGSFNNTNQTQMQTSQKQGNFNNWYPYFESMFEKNSAAQSNVPQPVPVGQTSGFTTAANQTSNIGGPPVTIQESNQQQFQYQNSGANQFEISQKYPLNNQTFGSFYQQPLAFQSQSNYTTPTPVPVISTTLLGDQSIPPIIVVPPQTYQQQQRSVSPPITQPRNTTIPLISTAQSGGFNIPVLTTGGQLAQQVYTQPPVLQIPIIPSPPLVPVSQTQPQPMPQQPLLNNNYSPQAYGQQAGSPPIDNFRVPSYTDGNGIKQGILSKFQTRKGRVTRVSAVEPDEEEVEYSEHSYTPRRKYTSTGAIVRYDDGEDEVIILPKSMSTKSIKRNYGSGMKNRLLDKYVADPLYPEVTSKTRHRYNHLDWIAPKNELFDEHEVEARHKAYTDGFKDGLRSTSLIKTPTVQQQPISNNFGLEERFSQAKQLISTNNNTIGANLQLPIQYGANNIPLIIGSNTQQDTYSNGIRQQGLYNNGIIQGTNQLYGNTQDGRIYPQQFQGIPNQQFGQQTQGGQTMQQYPPSDTNRHTEAGFRDIQRMVNTLNTREYPAAGIGRPAMHYLDFLKLQKQRQRGSVSQSSEADQLLGREKNFNPANMLFT